MYRHRSVGTQSRPEKYISIALAELVEKGAQDEIVRELLTHVDERLMDFEIEQRTGAEYGERTLERSNSRNGYRERLWDTRVGSVDLRIDTAETKGGDTA